MVQLHFKLFGAGLLLHNRYHMLSNQCFVFIRCYRSAYRLKPGSLKSEIHEENKCDETKYEEKISDAVLHKRRSPYRLFENRNYKSLSIKYPSPNAPYYDRDDLPTYGSYSNYVKEAERVRIQQREKKLFWKNMDYWLKQHMDQPKYVNIGFPLPNNKRTRAEVRELKESIKKLKSDPKLEKAARERTLQIDVDDYLEERDASIRGVMDGFTLGMHNNIYFDLFGHGMFYPLVQMNISYDIDDENVNPVYYGNEISPSEASTPPHVLFNSDSNHFWSLFLVNPDGNLEDNNAEYLHWFVGNIKGSDISSGQTIVDYMQPIPVRGTGYHRMVFLLFKQDKEIDFSEHQKSLPCLQLRERDFKIRNFYRKYKENLTPVSFRFFQTKWEKSIQTFYQETLDMPEPIYEFIPTKVNKLGQLKLYPHKKTMDWLRRFMPKEPIYPGGGAFT